VADEGGDGRRHGLIDIALRQARLEPGLGLRRHHEDEARRAAVAAGRPEARQVPDLAQQVLGDRPVDPVADRAGLAEDEVEGGVVGACRHGFLLSEGPARPTGQGQAAHRRGYGVCLSN